jgi:hypothetical protein
VADFQFMTRPVTVGTIVAQGDNVGCRIAMDAVVNAETIAHEVTAVTLGPLTAA